MAKNFTSNTSNFTSLFICEKCDFKCDKKGDFNRHILTAKHKRLNMANEITSITSNFTSHDCPCGKKYIHQSSLLKHKKTCVFIKNEPKDNENKNNSNAISEEKIINLIQENNKDMVNAFINAQTETTNKLIDIIPKVNNTNTINNNQKFNINIFLNEECKEAINMSDFISKIELNLENLDYSKRQGLEAGLTNVIIEHMKSLSLYERPIHCTDKKRETLYIKENDTWEKDIDKTKIKEAIKELNNSHYSLVKEWLDNNPDYMKHDDKQLYFAKILKTCGAVLDDEKVIRKLCSSNYIKKELNNLDENLIE